MHFQTGWRQKFAVDRRSKHYQSKEAQMKKIIALTLALTGVAGLPCAALAAAPQNPATASFNVTITLVKQCSVTTPANISLGAYGAVDLISTTATGTTSFNLTCTAGTAYTIGFAGSDDLTAGSPTHQMKGVTTGNTNVVQYQLTDATPSAGNTAPLSASSSVISGTGTGVAVAKTLQAKVINYTTPDAPDTYTDTVTMSVTY
jgi:spore coat protein U-like protein